MCCLPYAELQQKFLSQKTSGSELEGKIVSLTHVTEKQNRSYLRVEEPQIMREK